LWMALAIEFVDGFGHRAVTAFRVFHVAAHFFDPKNCRPDLIAVLAGPVDIEQDPLVEG